MSDEVTRLERKVKRLQRDAARLRCLYEAMAVAEDGAIRRVQALARDLEEARAQKEDVERVKDGSVRVYRSLLYQKENQRQELEWRCANMRERAEIAEARLARLEKRDG